MELRSDLDQQTRWRTGLEGLSTSTHISFLHIDAAPLKEALMPVTQHATEQVLASWSWGTPSMEAVVSVWPCIDLNTWHACAFSSQEKCAEGCQYSCMNNLRVQRSA